MEVNLLEPLGQKLRLTGDGGKKWYEAVEEHDADRGWGSHGAKLTKGSHTPATSCLKPIGGLAGRKRIVGANSRAPIWRYSRNTLSFLAARTSWQTLLYSDFLHICVYSAFLVAYCSLALFRSFVAFHKATLSSRGLRIYK